MKAYLLHQQTFEQQVKMIMMRILAVVSAVLVTACAAPVPKEASMDWAAFIASVPGTDVGPLEDQYKYKTSTIKNSLYRYGSGSLEASFLGFERWCKAHGRGLVSKQTGGTFHKAVNDWIAHEKAHFYTLNAITHRVCLDERGRFVSAMLVRQNYGFSQSSINENRFAPVIAFYTPEQATQFVDFHNAQRAESVMNSLLAEKRQRDRQDENTRRLRASPKIGDRTDKGLIIDLRPPLALIQYDLSHRLISQGTQSNWVPINELVAPSDVP